MSREIIVTSPFDFPYDMENGADSLIVFNDFYDGKYGKKYCQVDHSEMIYSKDNVKSNKELGWFGCWRKKITQSPLNNDKTI